MQRTITISGDDRDKLRVAIGAFDSADRLIAAVREMRASMITSVIIALIDSEDAPVSRHPRFMNARRLTSLEKLSVPVACRRGANVSLYKGGAPSRAESLTKEQEAIVRFDNWVGAAMAQRLHGYIAKGACLLFAVVNTLQQEQQVCGALFRYSFGQVQVHDATYGARGE